MKLWSKGIFKIFALVAMLCVVGSAFATSTLSEVGKKPVGVEKVNVEKFQEGLVNELNANKDMPIDIVILNYLNKNKDKIKILYSKYLRNVKNQKNNIVKTRSYILNVILMEIGEVITIYNQPIFSSFYFLIFRFCHRSLV
ncbi:hypothetical protein [Methanocaldococcus sp.]